jgi:hypothetical protein
VESPLKVVENYLVEMVTEAKLMGTTPPKKIVRMVQFSINLTVKMMMQSHRRGPVSLPVVSYQLLASP